MKPYQKIPILDCGEPLVAIPGGLFALVLPHPYETLGAPYGGRSPFYLRQGVLTGLIQAQTYLQQEYPHWQISIFDAYRPVAVQQFMVEYAFTEQVRLRGLNPEELSASERQEILAQVYQFWAVPSLDPAIPPPHATGAAVDVMLVDEGGMIVEMGSPIDEISPRSHPNYFANSSSRPQQDYHEHRQILASVMELAGFAQHPNEWWHFCKGDQMWAWLTQEAIASYGRVE